jgi:hypothetical protein
MRALRIAEEGYWCECRVIGETEEKERVQGYW